MVLGSVNVNCFNGEVTAFKPVSKGAQYYSGNITLIVKEKNAKRRTPVYIKVFKDCPKHYAILYKSDNLGFQYGFFDY